MMRAKAMGRGKSFTLRGKIPRALLGCCCPGLVPSTMVGLVETALFERQILQRGESSN